MDPKQRNGLIIAGGILVALEAGWQIANESLILSGLVGGGLLIWFGAILFAVRPDAWVAGLVLAGYLIGNRGFAQISIPTVPLLPGELAIGIGIVIAVWNAARNQRLPWQQDALNFVLIAWLLFGALRCVIDVRVYGLQAMRDFAILYYALFFFLAQGWWAEPECRRWLTRCLSVGFAIGAPVFLAFTKWPEFFINNISVGGVPLIFMKSDVQAALLTAGTFWFLHRYASTRRPVWLLLTAVNLLGVVFANNRAGLVALGSGCLWLLLCRDWKMLRPIAALGAIGIFCLVSTPLVTQTPWKKGLAYRFYETALSMIDIRGTQTLENVDLSDKPDNNLFRLTWWRSVAEETWAEGRWMGLGFGYNLSDKFVRVYYAESGEDFRARSPHNYPLTVLGRTGLVGLTLLAACLTIIAVRTWRAGRGAARSRVPSERFAVLLGVWGIFVSACFGVVLEGPMGAAVFWSLLGMASAADDTGESESVPGAETTVPEWEELAARPQVSSRSGL